MDKKLPSISKFSTNKVFSNNKDVYYSSYNKEINSELENTKDNSIDNIFKEGEYIFNMPVVIKTNSDTYKTTIIGKLDDHIITSNRQTIKIKDIVSIKMK